MRIAPYYVYHPYYVTSIGIGILGIFVCIILFVMILRNKNTLQKGKYALIALLVGLLSHVLFFICTPQYVYNFHPQWLMYKSLDGKYIVNKDIYFYFVKKYGYSYSAYARFKTVEGSIEAFEFAKSVQSYDLYNVLFEDLDRGIGYKGILNQYKDKTFQMYFIRYTLSRGVGTADTSDFFNRHYQQILEMKSYVINEDIIGIIDELKSKINLILKDKKGGMEIKESILKNAWKITGINEKVFYSF